MEDEEEVFEENRNDENTNSDGSDQVVQKCHKIGTYLQKKPIRRGFSFINVYTFTNSSIFFLVKKELIKVPFLVQLLKEDVVDNNQLHS